MNEGQTVRFEIDASLIQADSAERIFCAMLMHGGEGLSEALQYVSTDDFRVERYKLIVEACISLMGGGVEISPYTVAEHIVAKKKFSLYRNADGSGGAEFFDALLHDAHFCTASELIRIAKPIREASLRRSLSTHAASLMNSVARSEGDPKDLVAEAINNLSDALTSSIISKSRHIKDILEDTVNEISRRAGKPAGTETGFAGLDQLFRLKPAQLTILAARPGVGKTALALNIATNIAINSGGAVFFASLEMSEEELASRMLTAIGEMPAKAIEVGNVNDYRENIVNTLNTLADADIWVDDEPMQTTFTVAAKAKAIASQQPLGLIVVDYLQLLTPDDKRTPRHEQVAGMSRQLKGLSKQLDVPVLCLCQLNRAVTNRSDPKPMLQDLRESGAIEQDADVVAMLYLADSDDKRSVSCHIAKNRGGPVGVAELKFTPELVRFENIEDAVEWNSGEPDDGF